MAAAAEIKTALSLLDPTNDEHWTKDGLPAITIVQQAVQGEVTRAEVTNADPQFNRATALAAADDAQKAAEAQKAKQEAEKAPEPKVATVAKPNYEELTVAVDAAEADVLQARLAVEAAQRVLDQANAARDRLVHIRDVAIPPHVNQVGIMDYLEKQKQVRADKAARSAAVLAAGITPEMLRGKAPIDQAMARKRGFGLNRPQVPFGNK